MALSVGICIVMACLLLQSSGRYGGGNGQEGQKEGGQVIATLGDVPVKADQVTSAVSQMESQSQRQGDLRLQTFSSTANLIGYALSRILDQDALLAVAENHHADLSDASLLKAASAILQERMPPSKKPDPKMADQVKQTLDHLKTMLADPEKRDALIQGILPKILTDSMSASIPATIEDVKHSYDTYELKRILLAARPGVDPKAKSEEVEKALKSGMSFEAAMDKFSSEPPPGLGKKVSDSKIEVPNSQISTVPSYKAIEGKPVGFVSDPISDPSGLSIYKVVSIKNNAPNDFATNVAKYKKQYIEGKVEEKIEAERKAVVDSSALQWNSEGYKAIYDLNKISESPSPLGRDAELKKIIDLAKVASKKPADRLPALYAWFSAESQLYGSAGPNKAKMAPERIELLKAVLEDNEDYELRMELVDLYIQQKDGADALQNLVQASETNGSFDVNGQNRYRDIGAKGQTLVADKLVPANGLSALNEAQANWLKGKADADKLAAETKAEEAQQKIKDAAEKKANEALIAKQKEQAANAPKNSVKTPTVQVSKPSAPITGMKNPSPAPSTSTTGH